MKESVGRLREFRPQRVLPPPEPMRDRLSGVFERSRVIDHATVRSFMCDQVNAREGLQIDAKLAAQATLRAAIR
eukprot:1724738-Alexandrium_andersonii.AAC.1